MLFSFSTTAQKEMLIEQLSGRTITRKSFDKNKKLINKQVFKVGKLSKEGSRYQLVITAEMFDENGKSTDKYSTTYKCKPNESSVLVLVFSFSKPKSKKTGVTVKSSTFDKLYKLDKLNDVAIQITFDSGALNFFGSKSNLKFYDRKLTVNVKNQTLESKLSVNAYAWGVRVKSLQYKVLEKLTLSGLLYYQKFTESDGSYFTMNYSKG
ncbi:MAG: hypothetical protein COA33_011065 [Fluviicola sp.]|nr:hypothetical protein [Fluviicola sp.]